MPAVSQAQQMFMGAAYARAKKGKRRKGDPKMSKAELKKFASTPRAGLPRYRVT